MPVQRLLVPPVRVVVFDAYGTLFDVHAAVTRHSGRVGPDAARISELWRQKQLEYSWTLSLAGRYESFWTLTERALDYALARFAVSDSSVRADLLAAYRTLQAYPDAASALDALKSRGLRTAILSNGSLDMLGAAIASAELRDRLDAVLSVDAVRVFKTDPRAYQLVLDAFDIGRDGVLFVSSNRWDVAGATAFGFKSVWVNRAGLPDEYPELAPVAVLRDLSTFGSLVA